MGCGFVQIAMQNGSGNVKTPEPVVCENCGARPVLNNDDMGFRTVRLCHLVFVMYARTVVQKDRRYGCIRVIKMCPSCGPQTLVHLGTAVRALSLGGRNAVQTNRRMRYVARVGQSIGRYGQGEVT